MTLFIISYSAHFNCFYEPSLSGSNITNSNCKDGNICTRISQLNRIKHYIGSPINLNTLHIKAKLLVVITKLKIWEAILHYKTQND